MAKSAPFGSTLVCPEGIPVLVNVNGPEAHHALCSPNAPVHSRQFQPVVNQMPTCALNDSAADVKALAGERFLVSLQEADGPGSAGSIKRPNWTIRHHDGCSDRAVMVPAPVR